MPQPLRPPAPRRSRPLPLPPARTVSCAALLAAFAQPAFAAAPDAPGAVSGDVDGDEVRLSWVAARDDEAVTGYNVYRDDAYLTTVRGTTHTAALGAGGTSSFYVVAFDTPTDGAPRGYSTRSPATRFSRTERDPTPTASNPDAPGAPDAANVADAPPAPPVAPVAERISAGSVRLTWTPPPGGAAGYNVYRDDRYLTTVRTTAFADVGLDAGVAHDYYVVAFDETPRFSVRSTLAVAPGAAGTSTPAPGTPPTTVPEDPSAPGTPVGGGELPPASPPTLDAPFADAIPSPAFDDPFGFTLEFDPEAPVPGGPPTQPKNLRLDYVGNAFAEFSWAPANDDTGVVAYRVDRSDGQSFTLTPSLPRTLPLDAGTFEEYEKYWATTSFVDCNSTRFGFAPGSAKAQAAPWNCSDVGPVPGDDFTYTVTAIDADGQASAASEPLAIAYNDAVNAPVPFYDDFYLRQGDRFASVTDLSAVDHFIDDFDLVWSDDFDGGEVDPANWQTEVVFGDQRIINGEQQYFVDVQEQPDFGHDPFEFTADEAAEDGRALSLAAVPFDAALRGNLNPEAAAACEAEDPTGLERCLFLSGALSSHDRFQFLYGYVEGRIRASTVPGALTSFYLYHRYPGGENDPRYRHGPEIDILEYLGENPFGDPDAFQTYHFVDPNTGIIRSSPTMNHAKAPGTPGGDTYGGEYHTFGVLWEPQLVVWYIDGREVKRIRGPQIARQPMNIVNYLVAGSGWAPTPDLSDPSIFPITSETDYIRVYQRRGSTSNFQIGR